MAAILFLYGDVSKANNDNHLRLPAAFRERGWRVAGKDHDTLAVVANELRIDGEHPANYDLIWPLGFGRHASFFDRMQLLWSLPADKLVTTASALLRLHGKHHWRHLMPETHTSNREGVLAQALDKGGQWVLKPTAGSYGRDVVRIDDADSGREALSRFQHLHPDEYMMLQRYVPQVYEGEKRTLVAGGKIIGSYLRRPRDGFISNLAAAAEVSPTTLSAEELDLVQTIARELPRLGAGFAAVDTVYPYLMEVNIANPGGLGTLESLGQHDATDTAAAAIERWRACWPRPA